MRIIIPMRAVAVATGLLSTLSFFPVAAPAASADYRLEAVEPTVPIGHEVPLAVRLVDAASGAPVANAVLFRTRLDMAPEGMGDMTAALKPAASSDPQVYRFTTTLSMAGRWLLAVQAKVPGVTETVRAETVVTGVEQPAGASPSHQH